MKITQLIEFLQRFEGQDVDVWVRYPSPYGEEPNITDTVLISVEFDSELNPSRIFLEVE